MADIQIDNGNFTRIHNEILEHLVASNLNGTELAIVIFIIRKTYGYNKLNDEISLSQFCNAIPVSKVTICSALSNLQLVKIIKLVKKGNSLICSNLWHFNKDFDTWQLVKKSKLVKISTPTSKDLPLSTSKENLTYKRQRTKDNTKEKSKFPPTLEMVSKYIKDKGFELDPEEYIDKNMASGWIMAGGKKVKDWEAQIRTWEKNRLKWNEKGLDEYQKAIKILGVIKYGTPTYEKKVWRGIDLASIQVALDSFYPDQMDLLPNGTAQVLSNLDEIKKHLTI